MSDIATLDDPLARYAEFWADLANRAIPTRIAARQMGIAESTLRTFRTRHPERFPMSKPTEIVKLSHNEITVDPRLQIRADLDRMRGDDYADAYRAGRKLPPLRCIREGDTYYLVDGHQRYAGSKAAGKRTVEVEASEGTFRDAWLYALGANEEHGVHRSLNDRRKAVDTALADPEMAGKADNHVAKVCKVSADLVKARRAAPQPPEAESTPAVRMVERGGKTYEMDTSNVGRKAPAEAESAPETGPKPAPHLKEPEDADDDEDAEPATGGAVNTLAPRRQDDEEWLESLPLRARLSERCREIFDRDAKAWRFLFGLESWLDIIGKARPLMLHKDPSIVKGPMVWEIHRLFFGRQGPERWLICDKCDGKGSIKVGASTEHCRQCNRAGYVTN